MEQPTYISREDARAAGLKIFYVGIPCKRGHLAPRYVNNPDDCLGCTRERRGKESPYPRAPGHRLPTIQMLKDQHALLRGQITYLQTRIDAISKLAEQNFDAMLARLNQPTFEDIL